MSKVFNMVGGGGGGKNISSIIITGLKSTDTVTCTKDGKDYAATWDATAQHWEIVGLPLGTFTVTATNGTKTTTETVLIDIAGVYVIEMDYTRRWLYEYGNDKKILTGGWSVGFGDISLQKNETSMTVTRNGPYGAVFTENKINTVGYSTLKAEFTGATTNIRTCIGLWTNRTENNQSMSAYSTASSGTVILDISNYQGDFFVFFGPLNATEGRTTIKAIWLE